MEVNKFKVLVVDDEEDILEIISYNLELLGYLTETAKDGSEAYRKAKIFLPDLIILDVMMPHRSGFEAIEDFKRNPVFSDTRFIFLTALGEDKSEVEGLNLGADDYITKPIKPRVLMSRIKAVLRRIKKEKGNTIEIGNLKMDREKYLTTFEGKEIYLPRREFEILSLLASRPGRVFLRNEILDQIWDDDVVVGDRTVDVHIRKIRQKTGSSLIQTVKGVGYKFVSE